MHRCIDEKIISAMMNISCGLLHGKANDFAIEPVIRCFVVVGAEALGMLPIKTTCLLPKRVQPKYTCGTSGDNPVSSFPQATKLVDKDLSLSQIESVPSFKPCGVDQVQHIGSVRSVIVQRKPSILNQDYENMMEREIFDPTLSVQA